MTRNHGPVNGQSRRVRAPGRVNLIGEHLDYNGLPVLPVALDRHVELTFQGSNGPGVSCVSTGVGFEPVSFSLDEAIEPGPQGDWGNYLRAAGQALARVRGPLRGFEGCFSSSLPIAAGLSSSSALLVASALALIAHNELEFTPTQLMLLLAEAERYVGTAGGGMDQAICLGGQEGHALHIGFDPLELLAIPVPVSWRFVIASSLVPAAKSGAAQRAYNSRVEECRHALTAVVRKLGESVPDYVTLRSRWDTEVLLDVGRAILDHVHSSRFRHVLTEADRVADAVDAMREDDLERFGRLMLASHASLRDDYQVSCPELDRMVACAMNAGAAGARLTGAGFGGCVVALVEEAGCTSLLDELWEQSYVPRGLGGERRDEVLFVVRPSGGARVEGIPSFHETF